jgi:hypothetical protein
MERLWRLCSLGWAVFYVLGTHGGGIILWSMSASWAVVENVGNL